MTILIVARNAEATIERAVVSCLTEPHCSVVLADDHSSDLTVNRAVRAGGSRVSVVNVPDPGGVAVARQCALDAVTSQYAAWLDADDEWIPGRASRLTNLLERGDDIATEAIDLHDGPSGAFLRRLSAPAFVGGSHGWVRLFERNVLPGDTQVAFRPAIFRAAGGFDPAIQGPESFDLLLRALRRGARLAIGAQAGYRMYAYPNSLSRRLSDQRAALAAVLRKHAYGDVYQLYLASGYDRRIALWALVLLASYRGDVEPALSWLDEASPADADPCELLEPEGPWPICEGWRRAFHRGTLLLGLGGRDAEAADELSWAERLVPTAEGSNNLGVALARLGRLGDATRKFAAALDRFPGYVDATRNLRGEGTRHITTHPLRRAPSRTEYPVSQ